MTDVLAYDLPIRPIRPGDTQAPKDAPASAPPAQAGFAEEWRKLLLGLLGL